MVHFVGAGSGAVDLITVRGERLLSETDVVIYAGSTINKELLNYCKKNVTLYDSAYLTLEEVMNIIKEQLRKDYVDAQAGNSISLLAKWMPSINASSKDTRAKANMIISWLNVSPKEYRKTLSTLRAYLDVVEVKASSNKWSEIDYKAVPSQANLKYKDAFLKHDRDRRIVYLDNLSAGKAKINASVVQPHEIVSKYTYECRQAPYISDTILYDETYEQMWKALPNIVVEDTLVVRDGSYSMASCAGNSRISCLDVATALAIYCSEHNSPAWADKFITFSSHPEVVNLKHCTSLKDKLNVCRNHSDCSNTDIARTMRLILRTAVENNISQEEMPRNILIVSDMQFDGVWNRNKSWNKTLFECIAIEYDSFGYKLPRMIFWNVCDRNTNTIPMQDNENGLILCSGFSINAMKMFMSGEIDPLKVLLSQLDTPRYKPVEKALEKVM